jgi:type II secretory pathway pseudopilin PulG
MMTRRLCSSARAAQAGRTLIELVIAMAIGMVIVIGVSALYLSSSGISRTANQISTAEQAGQLAMLMIGDAIKLAGYGEVIGSDFEARDQTLFDGAHVRGCTGQRFVDPIPAYTYVVGTYTPVPAPDLTCAGAVAGDALFVRFQAEPAIAVMTPADADRISVRDCLAQRVDARQLQTIDPTLIGRPGSGFTRRMVVNVFQFDPVNNTLDCRGNGAAAFQTILNDVDDFRVFYRFDDAGFAIGAAGFTNAAPFGASIRDAAFINGLAGGPVDPWNYVVAAIVCLTVRTSEIGVSTSGNTATATTRCPATAAEAETGLVLTSNTTDGRVRRTFAHIFTLRSRATASPSLS